MNLARSVIDAVNRYWAKEVQILGAWEPGPATLCVVYRRTIDPDVLLGCKLKFHENPADGTGTIEGFARDAAVNLAEPIGVQASRTRKDPYGIHWVGLLIDELTPSPPTEVLDALTGIPRPVDE